VKKGLERGGDPLSPRKILEEAFVAHFFRDRVGEPKGETTKVGPPYPNEKAQLCSHLYVLQDRQGKNSVLGPQTGRCSHLISQKNGFSCEGKSEGRWSLASRRQRRVNCSTSLEAG